MNVYFIVVIQILIAGGTHIVAKAVVQDVDAATLTFIRSIISTVGLGILLAVKVKRITIERGDWGKLALLGFFGLPINQFFYLYGMKFSTAANGALLYGVTPVFVLLLSHFILKEKITAKKTAGILLAFAGVAVVVFERGIDFSSEYTYGNLMILLAVIAWALFTIYGKPMILKYGAIQTTCIAMILGMLIFLPVGIISIAQFPLATLGAAHWAGILYLGVGTSILAYLMWYYALGRIDAAKLAVFANGQPVVATLLALAFLDYTISGEFIIGGIVTITGVILTQLG
ncbi:MAG: EamA family transporter [Ignavibacteriae bacterium]|nr:EamA family transporter [Ignavibacteriota bacterium]